MLKKFELTLFVHNKEKNYPIIKVISYEKSIKKASEWASYEASKLALQYQALVSLLKVKEIK